MQPLLKRTHRLFTWTVVKNARSKSSQINNVGDSPLRSLLQEASSYGEAEVEAVEPELRWATQPYATRSPRENRVPRETPREATVLLFPGASAQHVGMGRRLLHFPAARELYELASSVVGWDVARTCTAGPADELARRVHTAVLVTALASLERVRDERPAVLERARAAAGPDVGELAALVFADALPLERALRLAELLAAAERAAAADRPSGVSALELYLAPDARLGAALRAACDHAAALGVIAPVCTVAQYLYPGCKVIAGDEEALRFVEAHSGEFGMRATRRAVAASALHTPLGARAEAALRAALEACSLRAPRVRVWSCTEARAYRDAAHVRRALPRLATRPLRWEQTLQALLARPRGEEFPLALLPAPAAGTRRTLRRVNARAWDCSLPIEA